MVGIKKEYVNRPSRFSSSFAPCYEIASCSVLLSMNNQVVVSSKAFTKSSTALVCQHTHIMIIGTEAQIMLRRDCGKHLFGDL